MKNPKIGERIIVYGSSQTGSKIVAAGSKGVIIIIYDANWLRIKLDGDEDFTFHVNQCRRLVKKERRRVWINEYSNGLSQAWHSSAEEARLTQVPDLNQIPGHTIICREFVEVKRKK